jgi:hypothetical protein
MARLLPSVTQPAKEITDSAAQTRIADKEDIFMFAFSSP